MSLKTYTMVYVIETMARSPEDAARATADVMREPTFEPHFYYQEFAETEGNKSPLSLVLETLSQIDLEQLAS